MAPSELTKKYYIIFDIDSTTIGGGIFEFIYDKKGNFTKASEYFSVRKNITNGKEYPFDDFFARTMNIFKEVADLVYRESLVTIENIYINVGAPWMSSQKRSVHYKKKNPFVLTQELADKLIEQELAEQFSKNTDFNEHDVELIDRKTVDVYANGYPTRNPIGKTMSDVTLYSLTTVMSKDTKKSFNNMIESVFHRTPTMTSNTFVSYESTRRFLPDENDAIVLDISGELTEVSIIKKDHLTHIGTIPSGIHSIVRSLRDSLDISLEKAWGIVPMISGNHLEENVRINYERALDRAYTSFLKTLYHFLDTCSKEGLLPSTIVLKTHHDFQYWFEEQLLQSDELKEVMKSRNLSLIQLDARSTILGKVYDVNDDELSVIAAYLALYEKFSVEQKVL